MTTSVAAIYIVLMVLGLVWVIVRMVFYVRNQRQRESAWNEALYNEEFRAYLEKLKEQNPAASEADPTQESSETEYRDRSSPSGPTD